MGERKGQNFYYPPDFNYKKHKSLNAYHGVHALRERAAKIGQGILIIRFEMPFNIWCLGCNNHVGMGVRYNAEKKKIGMYYTTPLYEFRMKCHLCDNYYVIRTDPKNFDYELVEGCSRQEKRFDPSEMDGSAPIDRGEHLKLAADAMYKAEHKEDDRLKGTGDDKQVDHLEWLQERMRDDFSANSALRRQFRAEKKYLGDRRLADEDLRKRASLSIPLVPEREEDKKVASLLTRYKDVKTVDERQAEARDAISSRRIFTSSKKRAREEPSTSIGKLANSIRQEKNRKLNEQFDRKRPAESGLTRATLGIVSKKMKCEPVEPSDGGEETQGGMMPVDDLVEVKKEDPDGEKTMSNPLSFLADYSSSDSDSDLAK